MSLFKYCVLCYSYISFDKNLLKILTVKMFTTKNNNLNGEFYEKYHPLGHILHNSVSKYVYICVTTIN